MANQFEILSKLYDEDKKGHYTKKAEIVRSGFEGWYSELFQVLSEPMPEEVCDETMEILDMFRKINNSKAGLKNGQMEELAKLDFKGFDASHSEKHYYFMQYLIDKDDRWEEFKDYNRNSHSNATIRIYKDMLEYLSKIEGDLNYQELKDLDKILNG